MPVKPADSPDRQFANTLARGLQLLRCFTPADHWISNKEISVRTGLPRPTVSRLSHTLVELGYLSYDFHVGKYALATGVLSLAYPMLASMRIRQVGRPLMKALADEAGGSVSMGVRDQLQIVHVDTCRSPSGETTRPDIGLVNPLAQSSVGRAYLAVCSAAERQSLLNQLKVRQPEVYRAHRVKLDDDLKGYRKTGFSKSYGEVRADVNAVGAALRDKQSGKIFTFSFSAPATLASTQRLDEEIGPKLARTVEAIRISLGNA